MQTNCKSKKSVGAVLRLVLLVPCIENECMEISMFGVTDSDTRLTCTDFKCEMKFVNCYLSEIGKSFFSLFSMGRSASLTPVMTLTLIGK